jgi:hypothetical protein
MSGHYYVASKGVLAISTNAKDFKWSFGTCMPEGSEGDYRDATVKLKLTVADDDSEIDGAAGSRAPQEWGKYHYFSGVVGADVLTYRRKFLLGSELRLVARDLLTDEPRVVVNRHYYKYITHRFMNLHSIGYMLTDIAGMLLLRKGFAPLHCSAFRAGDATVLVIAPPNTGKTLTTMMACMDHGAEFLAEDLALTDGRTLYSVPWTSTFRYYSRVDERLSSRFASKATEMFPPLELFRFSKPNPVNRYVEQRRILDSSPITHVAILERGDDCILEEDRSEVLRRVLNLNRYEFNYHKAPAVVAHEYFNGGFDTEAAQRAEREVLRNVVTTAGACWVVRSMDPTRYARMLLDRVRS